MPLPFLVRRPVRAGLAGVGVLMAAAIAVLAWLRWEPSPSFDPAPPPPSVTAPPRHPAPSPLPIPPGFRALWLKTPPTQVIDGDTFEADLDGDGQLSLPRERVRLLYVDTPELKESWKGRDLAHGRPAREFLRKALGRLSIRLLIPVARPTGKYGRTLAIVESGVEAGSGGEREPVNLALIRAGHSYFDTRFSYPESYDRYAAAEGEAFDGRRGIWAEAASRAHYLKRLRKESKTPAGRTNPDYVRGVLAAATFRPGPLLGKFVTLEGRLLRRKILRKGVNLLLLERGGASFPAVAYRRRAERLGLSAWPRGGRVRLDGFIKNYKGKLEMVIHHGRVLN